MSKPTLDDTILRTPNPDCPACVYGHLHTPEYLKRFHPLAGHGYTPEQGWTHPFLGKARNEA